MISPVFLLSVILDQCRKVAAVGLTLEMVPFSYAFLISSADG